jgi:solute carrier family 12 sodium/potassium/chloride transporter 2
VICATLSSALASLVGAPRVLQAVARDNLFPVLKVFGNGHGVNNEPSVAFLIVWLEIAHLLAVI